MSLRREPAAGSQAAAAAESLWQDPLATEQGARSHAAKTGVVSPRNRGRAASVAYIANDGEGEAAATAQGAQAERHLSLACLKEACADTRVSLKSIPFERISMATTDVLDSFYNAGELEKLFRQHPFDSGLRGIKQLTRCIHVQVQVIVSKKERKKYRRAPVCQVLKKRRRRTF